MALVERGPGDPWVFGRCDSVIVFSNAAEDPMTSAGCSNRTVVENKGSYVRVYRTRNKLLRIFHRPLVTSMRRTRKCPSSYRYPQYTKVFELNITDPTIGPEPGIFVRSGWFGRVPRWGASFAKG